GPVDAAVPTVHAVAWDDQGALVERLAVVVERRAVEVGDRTQALAAGAHPTGDGEAPHLRRLAAPALYGQRALPARRSHVERERLRGTDMGLTQTAEEDAEEGVGVGGGADRRADVRPHALLVDDDRGGEALQQVDVRAAEAGHEALHERAVGL